MIFVPFLINQNCALVASLSYQYKILPFFLTSNLLLFAISPFMPDQTFHNVRASKLVNPRGFFLPQTDFEAEKVVKFSVG